MKKIGLAIAFAAFALVGCSTTKVTEKAHDKLCSGTKKPYQVKGNWYTPQEDYDYEETGVASWYGEQFHGRPKSCGETFNMHGISAAHKTLPIPSVVRVTNIRNGSSVKLLVDDRGPFVGDRIIDLSKGAATYLGIHNQGLGKVRVECLPEESKAFARFVAQYGRYGRDPDGRSWEAIFRQEFDRDGGMPALKPLRTVQKRPFQRNENWGRPVFTKYQRPFRRPGVRLASASNRSLNRLNNKVSEKEIDQLLKETRAYLKRKQS